MNRVFKSPSVRTEPKPRRLQRSLAAVLALGLALTVPHGAGANTSPQEVPTGLKEVGFDQNLGTMLPLDTIFIDDGGEQRVLGDYFGEKPVVLAFVYYECPMLCSMVLNGIVASLRAIDFTVGEEFDLVAVSFDPRDDAEVAAAKKENYVKSYGRKESAEGWHFLTGEQSEIDRLTEAAGFRYTWDEKHAEFAHAAGIVVVTPEGQIARYFYGIDFPPRDLRLGLVEASESTIGNAIDQVLLYCFHYDPATGQYSVATMFVVRIAGVITLLILGVFLTVMFRRERKQSQQWAGTR